MKRNPFEPKRAVHPAMFVGRSEEIRMIKHALFETCNGSASHILVNGERGIGKSSLLNYTQQLAEGKLPIDKHERPLDMIVISMSILPRTTQNGFIRSISHALHKELCKRNKLKKLLGDTWDFVQRLEVCGTKLNKKELEEMDPELLLDELSETLSEMFLNSNAISGILLLIDEADKASTELDLGSVLKKLCETIERSGVNKLCIVLSGLVGVVDRLRASHMSAMRLFTTLHLEPLTESETIEVVKRTVNYGNTLNREQVVLDDSAGARIWQFSEGYPHFLQQFGYSAFYADSDNVISADDVIAGALIENGAFMQLGHQYFDQYFSKDLQSDGYRQVLVAMAERSNEWQTKSEIRLIAKVKETTLTNALKALVSKGIILQDARTKGTYRLPSGAFAIWIRHFANLPMSP